MEVKMNVDGGASQFSIREHLLLDVLSNDTGELSPWERLFIVNHLKVNVKVHECGLAALYMRCGCFSEAVAIYRKIKHWRKLGDLAWIMGNLDEAMEYYYHKEDKNSDIFRSGPDYDRLFKLAFYRFDWNLIKELIVKVDLCFLPNFKKTLMGNISVSIQPYLDIMLLGVINLNLLTDKVILQKISDGFGIVEDVLIKTIIAKSTLEKSKIVALQKRMTPKIPCQQISFPEAASRGKTERAQHLAKFIHSADDLVLKARKCMKLFIENGDNQPLQLFVEIVTQPGVAAISQTVLFSVMENDGYDPERASFERQVELYQCHPLMYKRYFGRLLRAKFRGDIALTGDNLLTGIFQQMVSIDVDFMEKLGDDTQISFEKLTSCRDWAAMRLEDWLLDDGYLLVCEIKSLWLKGKADKVSKPWSSDKHYPEFPNEMKEWKDLMQRCRNWLSQKWQHEIGINPWINETQVFELIKKAFKDKEVVRHAQPVWLAPQHLDVFVPDFSVAIEYMGEQHYCPVEFFGGQEGYFRTVERDKRKAEICMNLGIKLFYVRYDDDISACIKTILSQIQNKTL